MGNEKKTIRIAILDLYEGLQMKACGVSARL